MRAKLIISRKTAFNLQELNVPFRYFCNFILVYNYGELIKRRTSDNNYFSTDDIASSLCGHYWEAEAATGVVL